MANKPCWAALLIAIACGDDETGDDAGSGASESGTGSTTSASGSTATGSGTASASGSGSATTSDSTATTDASASDEGSGGADTSGGACGPCGSACITEAGMGRCDPFGSCVVSIVACPDWDPCPGTCGNQCSSCDPDAPGCMPVPDTVCDLYGSCGEPPQEPCQ